jgi:hypothetical protein
MKSLACRLAASGHRVHLIEEGAVRSPVPKKEQPHFNLWTAAMTLAEILGATYADAAIVLIDRGTFDALCWMEWCQRSQYLSRHDHTTVRRFLNLPTVTQLTGLVLVMRVDPNEAIRREQAIRPRENGTIMNVETLSAFNDSIEETVSRSSREFNLRELDTTSTDQAGTLAIVTRIVEELMPVPILARH